MKRLLPLTVLLLVAGGLALVEWSRAAESASRIIDRTMACTMLGTGYPDTVRFMTASATPFQPATGASPRAGTGNGDGSLGSGIGVGLRTGTLGPGSRTTTGELSLTRTRGTRCTATKLRIQLSSRGLKGGKTDPFGAYYRCDVPGKVLIRVRAVFVRPAAFSVDPRFPSQSIARGRIATGEFAVTTLRERKPIVFASVNDATGEARIFAAPGRCDRTS